MKLVKMELILGLTVIALFVLSSFVASVSAVQIEITEEDFERAYSPNPNNHTYVYVEPYALSGASKTTLHVDEDLHMRRYVYDTNGWTFYDAAYVAPDDAPFSWTLFGSMTGNIFSNTSLLPAFVNSIGADGGPAVLNSTVERSSFQTRVGQVTSLVLDPDRVYFGALGITSEEFIHLTISSRQDYTTGWDVAVIDPMGRVLGNIHGAEGDAAVLPFRTSGPGTYLVAISADADTQSLLVFDLLPQAVAPTEVGFGELVQGVLSGSELVVKSDTGSIVHSERTPTIHTYRFRSDDIALISYSFNYPELTVPVVPPTPAYLILSSDAFTPYYDFGQRHVEVVNTPTGDIVYYRSSNGETYYVTIVGGDNTEYALYHESGVAHSLPVNQEFRVVNHESYEVKTAYSLNLTRDSFMKINSSASGADYNWRAWAVYDNDMLLARDLGWETAIQDAQFYYLQAGQYVFLVTADSSTSDEFEFNIGPVHDEPSAEISRVGGFRVDSSTMTYFNGTLTLLTQDNITVRTHLTLYDRYAISSLSWNPIFANRLNGTSWMPHPTYDNFTEFTTGNTLTQGYSLVAVCTYRVLNNTEGATNEYADYPVRYGIGFDAMTDYYNATASLEIGTTSVEQNFTMPLPGEASENYLLELSVPKGVWFNVTVIAEDVDTFSAALLQTWGFRTHRTPWNDLNDELVGDLTTGLSFQFGSISDSIRLSINVGRDLSTDGFLYIRIEPFNTSAYAHLPLLVAEPPDFLAALAVYAVPIGLGLAVVIVVGVVYVKKVRK